ncbi:MULTISPECIES: DUF397 domain-containing protein [Streptomyces]|uniref:DUF397 domain-containing protein n=1 Tax=Streptomyces fradiae ATCC 10745 = DSM 40063 TaxID=1319510 RepID=A0A1Y2NR45_STRFR|nr:MULTISPECIES: DUF397 domain-containing protein [Streptomyces]KAF0650585.1 hypothetical protein K701_08405 [Streptomyces fradiae ATCC 10745 = DSM 40063]OSY50002.1 hypothetical protein BG846_04366 [Streptomyces fradiae ATCC 10745 = DSM 40063]QEV12920.1 DUF397 domain-containing protein [Streptomyces fradiae ATCC 10745 = DSM 40063]
MHSTFGQAAWRKSSHCATGDACIHLAPAPQGAVRLTESSDPSGTVLTLAPATWRAWRRAIGDGRLPRPDAEPGPGGRLLLRSPDDQGLVVTTTTAQWEAFAAGVRDGEFDRPAG